jgi:BASS family bile acid:Na+ symporter
VALILAGICLLGTVGGVASDMAAVWRPSAALLCLLLPLGMGAISALRGYQFTCWIISAFTVGMIYPERLQSVGPVDLRYPWLILAVVQLVMFGMGTQMRITDLVLVAKTPYAVGVGLLGHFTIMPLLGIALAKLFGLPNEIAAGLVLIGSCSSGLASNVMVYIAKGNLGLSVTITTVSTLLAPLLTPLWMKLLAGELVEVSFAKMMNDIIKIVIVPIGAAFVHDSLTRASARVKQRVSWLAGLGCCWIVAIVYWLLHAAPSGLAADGLILSVFFVGAFVFGVAYHQVVRRWPRLEKVMPAVSMFGIIYFTLVTTAAGRNALLVVGFTLFLAAVLHNLLGYCFGYFLSRAMGLDAFSARTVALEVGLQNGGMASGLAGAMGKLGTVGLAAAIFSPWMNVSGSVLANYWRRRPIVIVDENEDDTALLGRGLLTPPPL